MELTDTLTTPGAVKADRRIERQTKEQERHEKDFVYYSIIYIPNASCSVTVTVSLGRCWELARRDMEYSPPTTKPASLASLTPAPLISLVSSLSPVE